MKVLTGGYLYRSLTLACLSALVTSDAMVDTTSLVRTLAKDTHRFEERQIRMQLGSHTAVATITADGEGEWEGDREVLANRNCHPIEIDLLRPGRSQSSSKAADTMADSSSLVRTVTTGKHQFEERQVAMQPDSRTAVATVTANGEVHREALEHRNDPAGEIELLRTGRSQNAVAASDTMLDSSGLVLTVPKGKQQLEERRNPMQPDSLVAVATVTADGKVDREALVNRNGHDAEGELLRSWRSHIAYSASDAVVDSNGFVRSVPHIPVATVKPDEEVDPEASVNRKAYVASTREEPGLLAREASQSIFALLSSRIAVVLDISFEGASGDISFEGASSKHLKHAFVLALVCCGIVAVAAGVLFCINTKEQGNDGQAVLARANLAAEDPCQISLPKFYPAEYEGTPPAAEHHPHNKEHSEESAEKQLDKPTQNVDNDEQEAVRAKTMAMSMS